MDKHCCNHNGRSAHHSDEFKENLIKRLNRIEGQVRGIQTMVQGDIYCDDVLTQISAVRSALSSVANMLFEAHTTSCLLKRLESGDSEVVEELLQTIRRMMK